VESKKAKKVAILSSNDEKLPKAIIHKKYNKDLAQEWHVP
jgi:hypothetical protein